MMRIGLVYDRFGDMPAPPGAPADWDAEFEPEETIAALEAAIVRLGHEPVRIGNPRALQDAIAAGGPNVDAAVNIAEGYGGRNREAYAPVLLEMAGIPYIGSDALALSATLDKHLAKLVVSGLGLATPAWRVVGQDAASGRWPDGEWKDGKWRDGEWPVAGGPDTVSPRPETSSPHWPLAPSRRPVIVKPRYEGTAKGIVASSRCNSAEAVHAEVSRQATLYDQDLIMEAFIEGAEYTVAVVGHPPRALPALQRATENTTGIGIHALADKTDELEHELAGTLTPELERRLADAAVRAHSAFDCRDFSRSDFRVDDNGEIWFLEINPLPTFAPDGTFAIIAELCGRPYDDFLADVIGAALRRLRV
jgi:D-alanine-D-alanine ligase